MERKPIVTDDAIKGFFGEYRWLSNFHLAPVVFDGDIYPSTEHAFQAAKFGKAERNPFTIAPKKGSTIGPISFEPVTCRVAKEMGGHAKIVRETWEAKKVQVMHDVVMAKFICHYDLRQKLIATGSRKLVELNDWGDRFWGVETEGDKEVGFNMLGSVLESVRGSLHAHNFSVDGLYDIVRIRKLQSGV